MILAADHPLDAGARLTLRGRAQALTTKFNDLNRGIDRIATEATLNLSDKVDDANQLLDRVAELNVLIAHARHAGAAESNAGSR